LRQDYVRQELMTSATRADDEFGSAEEDGAQLAIQE
jgi:hypothetical protein